MSDILSSISTIKNFQFNSNRTTCNDYLYNALNNAVESMEKQIPKKPLEIKKRHNFRGDVIWKDGYCPICKNEISSTYAYCNKCGNALDWSVEE